MALRAEMWFDVICPWAYLGTDRTALVESLGVEVTLRPYELHPELDATVRPIRAGGRLDSVHRRIAEECRECGLPFRPPSQVSGSRHALETTEAVRAVAPDAHRAVVAGLFAARFTDDVELSPETCARVVSAAGVDPAEVAAVVASGEAARAVDASIAEARDAGITATPAWRFDGGFVVVGVQPRAQMERWTGRLISRRTGPDDG